MDCSGPLGPSWTPVDPRWELVPINKVDFRDWAELPQCNNGTQISSGLLFDGNVATKREALAIDEPFPYYQSGGIEENIIPFPIENWVLDIKTEVLTTPY